LQQLISWISIIIYIYWIGEGEGEAMGESDLERGTSGLPAADRQAKCLRS